jgi:hypothetical protein
MKPPKGTARSTVRETDTPTAVAAVNLEQAEVIALLQTIAARLDDIYNMEVEQVHLLSRINLGLP